MMTACKNMFILYKRLNKCKRSKKVIISCNGCDETVKYRRIFCASGICSKDFSFHVVGKE